jgi:hypothetical protein
MELVTQGISSNFGGGLPERRGNTRFALREEVKYKVLHRRTEHASGTGYTVNICSGGILFTTQEKLSIGRMVEVSVNWPAMLHGTCPLKFVAIGRIVRADDHTAALQVDRYEFKTRGGASDRAQTGT